MQMENFTLLHQANITTHVMAGSLALLIGFAIIFITKGSQTHKKVGRVFLYLLCIVIFTGLMGVLAFGRHTFLLLITVLSGYFGFSGYRTLRTKSNNVLWMDVLLGVLALIIAGYYVYYMKTIGMFWQPVVTYSTIGALAMIVSYDFLRYLIPSSKYRKLWLFEHIYKMFGAFTALLSAFSGTVFAHYQPYSQLLPSIFGTLLSLGFIGYYAIKLSKKSIF
jgi:hypothetical protein